MLPLSCVSGLAIGQCLADADDRQQAGPPGRFGLGTHDGIGLATVGTTLGVAHDDMACPTVAQHLG